MTTDTATSLVFTVKGRPAPQGSKVAFTNPKTGRIVVKESSADKVKTWRAAVKGAALAAAGAPLLLTGPVQLAIVFALPRPKDHYGTGRNATQLRPSAPAYPTTTPDLSKLVRATEDALTEAGIWGDDSQVTSCTASKMFAGDYGMDVPGARISIHPLPTERAPF